MLLQFLSEAVLISVAGGVAGILVGGGLSAAIQRFAGIQTIVSYLSVVVAFGVSFTVGLAFGIMPAHRAARRSEEHTSELQSQSNLVCRLLLEKKKKTT